MPEINKDCINLNGFYQVDELFKIIFEFYGYEEFKNWLNSLRFT
jgi:hypothetical protein